MDLTLFKDIKLKGYFLKILGIVAATLLLSFILKLTKVSSRICGLSTIITFTINAVFLCLTLWELRKNNINVKSLIAKPKKKSFIFEVPLALIVTYLCSIGLILILLYILQKFNPSILNNFSKTLSGKHQDTTGILIKTLSFIELVILAPVVEEILFRGILLGKLYNKYGIFKAIVITSLLFFVLHCSTNPSTLIVGITNCILVIKYKSLIPSILVHSANNFIFFIKKPETTPAETNALQTNTSILIMGIFMVFIYIIYIYKNRPKQQDL